MINAMVAKTMAQSFEKRRTRHLQRLNRDSWHQDPAPSVALIPFMINLSVCELLCVETRITCVAMLPQKRY